MQGAFDVSKPNLMFGIRVSAIVSQSLLIIYSMVQLGFAPFFLYLTNWGLFLTNVLFILILIRNPMTARICIDLLPCLWLQNTLITLLYWILLSKYIGEFSGLYLVFMIFAHSLPFVFTTVEMWLNQVKMYRKHTLYGMAFQTSYILFINLPYTLAVSEIYPDLNYRNWYTYLSAIGSAVGFLVCGELMIILKRKVLEGRNTKVAKSNLITLEEL